MEESLCLVMEDLAEQIARDGEGATKLITIRVVGAVDEESATKLARSIANSILVKTAIAGSDPNWGRILSAAGTVRRRVRFLQGRHLHAGRAGLRGRSQRGFLRSRTENKTG